MASDTDAWWAEFQAGEKKVAAKARAKWLAEHDETADAPELEFPYPDCSVCGLTTTYHDGDSLCCDPCGISWPSNGAGGEFSKCESKGPAYGSAWHEHHFCRLRHDHGGACADGDVRWNEDDEDVALIAAGGES